jgi:endoglucanase
VSASLAPDERGSRIAARRRASSATPRPLVPRPLVLIVALVLTLALAGPALPAAPLNPFAGARLFVDPASEAARQVRAWEQTRPGDAALLERIASEPQADWYFYGRGMGRDVRARVSQVTASGALPLLVAYFIPSRDCGGYSSGGARTGRAYEAWIRSFAAAIGTRAAAVILEPDALDLMGCLSARARRRRLRLLRYAVHVLAAQPRIWVYLDAGNSHWEPASVIARRLQEAGVDAARGFALGVTAFRTTAEEAAYGHALVRRLRGAHFVIDTSRNGLGPAPRNQWCNPPGRALGTPPTAATGDPAIDAFLWIKHPGDSDGSCDGAPASGTWWPAYALGLAARAVG